MTARERIQAFLAERAAARAADPDATPAPTSSTISPDDTPIAPARRSVARTVASGATWVRNNAPTPGGIATLLIVIIVILLAIQPTESGATRLQLIWQSIAGGLAVGDDAASGGGSSSWGETGGGVSTYSTLQQPLMSDFVGGRRV